MWLLNARSSSVYLIAGDPKTNEPFDSDWRNRVMALGKTRPRKRGVTFNRDKEARNSHVRWIEPDDDSRWLFEQVTRMVNAINAHTWHFDLSYIMNFQFTEYCKGGHYDFHVDELLAGGTEQRKLSFAIPLNDRYEGGSFMIQHGRAPEVVDVQPGQMVLFPSFLMHRVTPVTRGVRYSLVGWVCGPAWR
ncbi:MAG: prolyl hydroxylase family protein [Alphaproteobacteria bacterium]